MNIKKSTFFFIVFLALLFGAIGGATADQGWVCPSGNSCHLMSEANSTLYHRCAYGGFEIESIEKEVIITHCISGKRPIKEMVTRPKYGESSPHYDDQTRSALDQIWIRFGSGG